MPTGMGDEESRTPFNEPHADAPSPSEEGLQPRPDGMSGGSGFATTFLLTVGAGVSGVLLAIASHGPVRPGAGEFKGLDTLERNAGAVVGGFWGGLVGLLLGVAIFLSCRR
jgi:hypothetical protein